VDTECVLGRIISVHSFRGGTGKSNTTANLAATIALHGNRVGIVDTDIQSPGVHVIFGLDESGMDHSLNDYLWGRCEIADTAYDVSDCLGGIGGSIFLMPASIRAGDISRVLREGYDVDLLTDGFRDLIEDLNLDYLFIDTHPGLNEETLLSITISDALVLLLRPDRQDFQGTAVTLEVARQLDVPRLFLVMNKVLPVSDDRLLKERAEGMYGQPVAAVLPLSEEMILLGSSGLFCLQYPEHELTRRLTGIASLLEW